MSALIAFEDPDHEGNSAKYHSGRACDVKGCADPAGTMWGPYWCFKHNVERIKRLDASLSEIIAGAKAREAKTP